MALKIRDAKGGMLIEAVIVIAVIATLGWLSVRQSIVVAQTRADRASLEAMQELAASYLNEARLANCATATPTSPDEPCFVPFAGHVDFSPASHQTQFTVTTLNGRPALFDVEVSDSYSAPQYGIQWPIREITVTDSTGRLELTRAAVGKPPSP
ncbi:MAG: hypothetical protein F4Z00_12455 [Acidimicrobiaceae bacterium]|nr:hypothetical protein [Acidimicrobiaceae bacterium]MXZ66338.1 hypothetical protein [Acidimicrobiaceae bacterium]MYF32304.1 hypothetical protein [Acidimicrobiaceae bacterium]MYG77535.1 hypothetical protein [Acidimicrobiaceae bacterium]